MKMKIYDVILISLAKTRTVLKYQPFYFRRSNGKADKADFQSVVFFFSYSFRTSRNMLSIK